jgi:hypothetical protein
MLNLTELTQVFWVLMSLDLNLFGRKEIVPEGSQREFDRSALSFLNEVNHFSIVSKEIRSMCSIISPSPALVLHHLFHAIWKQLAFLHQLESVFQPDGQACEMLFSFVGFVGRIEDCFGHSIVCALVLHPVSFGSCNKSFSIKVIQCKIRYDSSGDFRSPTSTHFAAAG